MMVRKYTGFNGNASGKLAGTEEFMRQLELRTNKAIWNLGTFGIRLKRDKTQPSVHGTGRAGDASYRHVPKVKGIRQGRPVANRLFNVIAMKGDIFGLELLIDYQYGAYGRSWRCDQGVWKTYEKPTVYGGGFGDWYHFELSPEYARDAEKVRLAFLYAFGPPHKHFLRIRAWLSRL